MLKFSKGKIRFAILLKSQREVTRRNPVARTVGVTGNNHLLADFDVDGSVGSPSPGTERNRVRAEDPNSRLTMRVSTLMICPLSLFLTILYRMLPRITHKPPPT